MSISSIPFHSSPVQTTPVLATSVQATPVQTSGRLGLGPIFTATLNGSKQTALVERTANEFSATVPGPPQITASGETVLEATAHLESRVNLYG